MDLIHSFIQFMQSHEAVLSGAAAAMGIAGLMTTWCVRIVQQTGFAKHVTWSNFADRIAELPKSEPKQEIRFCNAPDGSALAYATSGAQSGIPIVRSLGWFTHLEAEWAYSQGRALWAQLGLETPTDPV